MTAPATPGPDDAAQVDVLAGTGASAAGPRPGEVEGATRLNSTGAAHVGDRDGSAAVIVTLPAEIDIANSLDACLQLCVAIDGGAQVVIADMTRTRFCDSSGFRMLLVAADIAAERDTQFRVVVLPGSAVLRAIGVMAFDRVLNIYFRLPEALRDPGR